MVSSTTVDDRFVTPLILELLVHCPQNSEYDYAISSIQLDIKVQYITSMIFTIWGPSTSYL